MKIQEVDRFRAATDEGKTYTIVCMQHFRTFRPLSGPAQDAAGSKEYVTTSGLHCNQIDSETYKIVETDEIVRKL